MANKPPALPADIHAHFRKANILHGYFVESIKSSIPHALGVGEELLAAKADIPHGRWESECERLFDGSLRTAQFYMQLAKTCLSVPKAQTNAILYLETTLAGAVKAAKKAVSDQGKPGGDPPSPLGRTPASSGPATGEAAESTGEEEEETDFLGTEPEESPPRPPRSGMDKPGGLRDYGKCPNCAGTKWEEDEFGVFCAKCRHPHGEPAGDVDEDQMATQRSKTVKTAEALMRAFDDLQLLRAKPCHAQTIETCLSLVNLAKEWK